MAVELTFENEYSSGVAVSGRACPAVVFYCFSAGVYVCVCVCERERERERLPYFCIFGLVRVYVCEKEREKQRERGIFGSLRIVATLWSVCVVCMCVCVVRVRVCVSVLCECLQWSQQL